jgi:hypothetical protein
LNQVYFSLVRGIRADLSELEQFRLFYYRFLLGALRGMTVIVAHRPGAFSCLD